MIYNDSPLVEIYSPNRLPVLQQVRFLWVDCGGKVLPRYFNSSIARGDFQPCADQTS
jgi:hypothetical protein